MDPHQGYPIFDGDSPPDKNAHHSSSILNTNHQLLPAENQRSGGFFKKGLSPLTRHPHAAPGLRKVVPDCHVLGATIVPNCERIGLPRKAAVKIWILHVLELFLHQIQRLSRSISISDAS